MDSDLRKWSRVDTGLMLGIGVVALGLRVLCAWEYSSHSIGRMLWVDEGAYWTRAMDVRAGHLMPGRPFYQDPLFPYALALLMKIVGPGIAALRISLACLGALTPMIVYYAGRRGLGRAEGLLAGLALAVYGPLVFTDGLLEKEGLGALVAALALAAVSRSVEPGRGLNPTWLAVGGWWCGLLSTLRANAMVLGLIGPAWAAMVGPKPRRLRRRILSALAFCAGFLVVISPVAMTNALVGRPPEFLLTTWQSGANFYIGNGPGATGTYWAPDFVEANPAREADDFADEARRRSGRPLTPGEVSRFWFREGLRRWRDAPIASMGLLVHKVRLVLNDFEIPDNQDIAFVKAVAAPHIGWGFLSFGWLSPWAALGLASRNRTPFWWFLVITTIAGLATTATFFVVARYRIPWTPGLALLASAGAVDCARMLRRGRGWTIAGRALLLALPAGFLAWHPVPDPSPDRWGHAEIVLGMAELGEGNLDAAIDALDDARAFGAGAANRVGEITRSGPVHDRLASEVGSRLRMKFGDQFDTRLDHARWLRQIPEGRAESRRLIDRALAEDDDDRRARRESGAWWLGETDNPDWRRRASADLARSAASPGPDLSGSILLAIVTHDRRVISHFGREIQKRYRIRMRAAEFILKH